MCFPRTENRRRCGCPSTHNYLCPRPACFRSADACRTRVAEVGGSRLRALRGSPCGDRVFADWPHCATDRHLCSRPDRGLCADVHSAEAHPTFPGLASQQTSTELAEIHGPQRIGYCACYARRSARPRRRPLPRASRTNSVRRFPTSARRHEAFTSDIAVQDVQANQNVKMPTQTDAAEMIAPATANRRAPRFRSAIPKRETTTPTRPKSTPGAPRRRAAATATHARTNPVRPTLLLGACGMTCANGARLFVHDVPSHQRTRPLSSAYQPDGIGGAEGGLSLIAEY